MWWARIVCLSAFGPYVAGSARTEQIAVFASVMFILVTGAPRMIRAPFGPAPFLVAWSGLIAVMLISLRCSARSTRCGNRDVRERGD